MEPTFRAGGLASGMDTNSIIDKLAEIEARPITLIAKRQAAMNVQISSIGSLISRLDALNTAAKGLKDKGISAIPSAGTYSAFSVSGSAKVPSRFSLEVDSLARAAKIRSTQFDTADSLVTAGSLKFSIDGAEHAVTVTNGMTVSQLAAEINKKVAPVSASLISDGSKIYLSVTRRDTGHQGDDTPANRASALTVVESPFTFNVVSEAKNAHVKLDGLDVYRRSNNITDLVTGATINLKTEGGAAEDVVFERDVGASAANLQKFVDAFNGLANQLRTNLRAEPGTKKLEENLSGSAVINLQQRLQRLVSTETINSGSIRTLTDIGVSLQRDGTIALDQEKLEAALQKDAEGVDAIFSRAGTGLGAAVDKFVKSQTNNQDGALFVRRETLQKTIKSLDGNIEKLKDHLETFRERLVRQFSAMESLVNGFNSVSNFLTQQTASRNKTT